MKVVPLERQTLFDIAIQVCGDVSAVVALALANGLSLSDMPAPGVALETVAVIDAEVVARYAAHHIRPATGIEVAEKRGIGGMGIEIDFIVT